MDGNWEQNKLNQFTNFVFKNLWPVFISFLLSLPIIFLSIFLNNEIYKILIFSILGPVIYGLKKYFYKLTHDRELVDFFKAIRTFFLRGTVVTFTFLSIETLLLFNINYYRQTVFSIVSILFIVLAFVCLLFYVYFVMIDTHYSFRVVDIFKLIIYCVVNFGRLFICTICLLIIMIYIISKIPNTTMFLVIFSTFVIIFYINENILKEIHSRFIKE